MLFWKRTINKRNIRIIGTVLAVSAFPALFLYLNNADEAGFKEILFPLLILIVIGVMIFFVCCLFIKDVNKAALAAVLYAVVLDNFSILEKVIEFVFRNMRYWHVLPMVIISLCLLDNLVIKKLPNELADILVKVIGGVVIVLIMINLITAFPGMIKYIKSHHEVGASQVQMGDVNQDDKLPNVYWLIFDEYSGFRQMEEYYSYDNQVLKDFLEENNFNYSESSRNEYYETRICVTNLMNIDYVISPSDDIVDGDIARKNGKVFSIMRELGYKVQVLETGDFLGQDSPTRDEAVKGAETINGETLSDLCLKQTVLYPFVRDYTSPLIANIIGLCNYLRIPTNIPKPPTFTVFYARFPHQPFLVDENGRRLPSEAFYDWAHDEYYLGQYKYCTKLMIKILENLVENDGNSVIILQSDHGARASSSELFKEKFTVESMTEVLNAVYMQGKELDIEGKSGVNTMRFLLDELYGLDFGEVEVPDYINLE